MSFASSPLSTFSTALSEIATTFVAPARVNLIGEHTDYTGGLVLPMAISFTTQATIVSAETGYTFCAEGFPEVRTLTPDDRSAAVSNWSDYPVGVLREFQKLGVNPQPFTLKLSGNVPLGSGLSSSASVEVASASAMLHSASATMRGEEIALLCQRAENKYVNSPCGIMDQFVITMAKAGHALLLHTRDLKYEHIPINGGELAHTRIVICNSMVKHSIAAGDYGSRRIQLEEGQALLVKTFPQLRDLGDATLDQLAACAAQMSENSHRRCRHVISENDRTRAATVAMRAGNATAFGKLMVGSHISQRDDFECSCTEVDFLVDAALKIDGCFGARLTGGGFGGCTVNLVAEDKAEAFARELKRVYRESLGIDVETYVCEAVDGAVARAAAMERHA